MEERELITKEEALMALTGMFNNLLERIGE